VTAESPGSLAERPRRAANAHASHGRTGRSARLLKRVVLGAWLLVVWLALWGSATIANVLGGLAVAAGVQLLPDPHPVGGRFRLRPLPALRFLAYFAYKMVEATLVVAREVVSRHDRINTGIVSVSLVGASDSLVTVVAGAYGLMPGSVTVEVESDPPTLYVHVLHLRSVDDVRRDIRRLEVLAVRAFGSPEAVADVEREESCVVGSLP
jgi:multicomponent Na+:H+ antiporter subunit E